MTKSEYGSNWDEHDFWSGWCIREYNQCVCQMYDMEARNVRNKYRPKSRMIEQRSGTVENIWGMMQIVSSVWWVFMNEQGVWDAMVFTVVWHLYWFGLTARAKGGERNNHTFLKKRRVGSGSPTERPGRIKLVRQVWKCEISVGKMLAYLLGKKKCFMRNAGF